MTKTAKKGDTVAVHYTGKLDNGEIFDSSRDREPLEFTLGSGQMIGGFDKAVEGMNVGEKKNITLEPSEAYGARDDTKILTFPKENLTAQLGVQPAKGMQLSANGMAVTIVDVSEKEVKIDFNHFLAGKKLAFEIELVSIK
ncbi:peptidylprolyl isomerase [archaeon CG10_big_fil_rev_8_21_14_0_10_43_11]|nr:MAG: peptidylprolyl isomerase [archaeon CG10_big_fil_rev_8_21_14_0_10_43_11]